MAKKVLIFQGGWDGHEPALVAKRFQAMLEKHGYDCEVSDSQDVLADGEKLMAMDLIVPCWTMGKSSHSTVKTSALQLQPALALQVAMGECAMLSDRMWSGNL